MTRHILTAVSLVAAGVVLAGASPALAWGPSGAQRGAMMKKMVEQRVDSALDAASVSPAQRSAIHQIGERVFSAFTDGHRGGAEWRHQMDQALTMFESDKIDQAAIASVRAEHQVRMEKMGDVVVAALRETHAALTHTQRQALGAYVASQMPEHGGHGDHMHGMHGMIQKHIDEALAAARLSPAQQTLVDAAREHVRSTIDEAMPKKGEREQALALFVADRWDDARVAALRAEKSSAMVKVGDAITQSLTDVHDALTPAQRKVVAGYLRAQRDQHMRDHAGSEHQE